MTDLIRHNEKLATYFEDVSDRAESNLVIPPAKQEGQAPTPRKGKLVGRDTILVRDQPWHEARRVARLGCGTEVLIGDRVWEYTEIQWNDGLTDHWGFVPTKFVKEV